MQWEETETPRLGKRCLLQWQRTHRHTGTIPASCSVCYSEARTSETSLCVMCVCDSCLWNGKCCQSSVGSLFEHVVNYEICVCVWKRESKYCRCLCILNVCVCVCVCVRIISWTCSSTGDPNPISHLHVLFLWKIQTRLAISDTSCPPPHPSSAPIPRNPRLKITLYLQSENGKLL